MHIPTGSIKRNLIGCIFAVGASILAFFLREALAIYFGPLPPYLTYYPAVMLVALTGGVWAGIVATLLGGFLGETADIPRAALFLVMGISISVVAGLLVQSWKRAAEYQKKLATLEGERRWRKLAESMPNLVWTCDPRGWCDYISSQWQAYTGIPVEKQLGAGWMEQIHPDDREQLRGAWKRAGDSGELYDIEFRIRRHDGQWRWFKNRAVPVRDDSGRIVEWYGSSTDVEDIKRAEDTSRKLYRTLLALSDTNQAVVHAEEESAFLQGVCNIIVEDCGHAMVWIGYAEQDVVRSIRPVAWSGFEEGYLETLNLTWADTERGRGPTGKAVRTGRPGMCRDMLNDPEFAPWLEEAVKRGYMSSIVLPLMDKNQAFGAINIYSKQPNAFLEDEVALLTGLARGVSFGVISLRTQAARVMAEEELRRSEARLREQNQLLEYAPVLVRNLKDEIILWNKGMEKLYGFTSEEALGKVSHEILRTRKPAPTSALLLEKGQWEGELQHMNKNGESMTVLSQQLLYTDADGKPVSIIEINKEITKRKRAEQALAEKTAQLESSIHELESFSYTISHDLRAPLRAIDGFSRMLLRDIGGKLDPESMRKFNVISSNSLKMAQLIEDLLSYSRTGRAALSKSKVDMQSLAQEVWRELRDGNPERKIEIRIKELPAAYGDRVLLRQVLSNLLGNAVKFTRTREQAIIEVSGSKDGDASVTYSVNDNGAGFDMQYYDRIFEIFRRLHSEKEFEGTGIGLAIVKKIIEKHGGTIRAEGRPGEGAAFHFTLPSR